MVIETGIAIISDSLELYGLHPTDRTLLSQMIYQGKKIYVKDIMLPSKSDALKMCYTDEQVQWVNDNEVYIWQYFIEKQILFNSIPSLVKRFIEPAPFSKFYLEIDNESPGRIGVWLGWQIIKSYMNSIKQDLLFNKVLPNVNFIIIYPLNLLISVTHFECITFRWKHDILNINFLSLVYHL
jgi:hypothetical protein